MEEYEGNCVSLVNPRGNIFPWSRSGGLAKVNDASEAIGDQSKLINLYRDSIQASHVKLWNCFAAHIPGACQGKLFRWASYLCSKCFFIQLSQQVPTKEPTLAKNLFSVLRSILMRPEM